MSDLISRVKYKSDLLKMVSVLNKQYRKAILNRDNDLILAIQNKQSAYTTALKLLDYEPTAYDSRKVIEELEKTIEIIKQNTNVTDEFENGYKKAIDDFVKMAYDELLYNEHLTEIDINYIAEQLKGRCK